MNTLMLSTGVACASQCPMSYVYVAGAAALVAGFVIGRITKRGSKQAGNGGRSGADKRTRQSSRKMPLPRQEPTHQPVPAGSVEIYVGNLNYDFTEEELRKLFEEYGEVSTARIVLNKYNGRSKGFGFVVMPNRSEAEKAIAAYSEKEYMGRKMRVNEAKNTITG